MKARTLLATLCLGVLFTSCLGSNPTTNTLRNWNGTVTANKWANEGIFLVTSPVHGLAWVGDVLVFNSWRFWMGTDLWLSDPGAYNGTGN
jgi:Domain of unknown function (DUF3332)